MRIAVVCVALGLSCVLPCAANAETRPPLKCEDYAKDAVRQQQRNQALRCGYIGDEWSLNYTNHLKWCIGQDNNVLWKQTEDRRLRVRWCAGAAQSCGHYANIATFQQQLNVKHRCGFSGDAWSSHHYNHQAWCYKAAPDARRQQTQFRGNKLFYACGRS